MQDDVPWFKGRDVAESLVRHSLYRKHLISEIFRDPSEKSSGRPSLTWLLQRKQTDRLRKHPLYFKHLISEVIADHRTNVEGHNHRALRFGRGRGQGKLAICPSAEYGTYHQADE
jgi:hypothetical protein